MITLLLSMFGIAVGLGFYFILCFRQLLTIRKEIKGVIPHRLILLNFIMILLSTLMAGGLLITIAVDVFT